MLGYFIMIACIVIGGSLLISLIIFVPIAIYTIPYVIWVKEQQTQYNIPKDIPSNHMSAGKKILFDAQNATKLYYSKITKKPHNITKF